MVETTEAPQSSETTRLQLNQATFFSPNIGNYLLYSPLPASINTYRLIAKDPTVSLAIDYAVGMISGAGETIESDDDVSPDQVKFIQRQWDKIRSSLPQIARDVYELGWFACEKIWSLDNGYATIKVKPLEQSITGLLIDSQHGELAGIVQPLILGSNGPTNGFPVKLDLRHCAVVNYMPRGSNWYGTSTLENVRPTFNDFYEANSGAKRYDKTIAGSHFVCYYPDGTNVEYNGETISAAQAAALLLESLESSGAITIPSPTQQIIGQLNEQSNGGWKIELLSDSTPRQPSFIQRMEYLDKRLVRGLGFTERSLLEGNNGTKAEAGVHGDVVLTILEFRHKDIIRQLNEQLIDDILEQNYGPEYRGKIRVCAIPIQKDSQTTLGEVYKQLLAADPEEMNSIDRKALRDILEVPSIDETEGGVEDIPEGQADENIVTPATEAVSIVQVARS